MTHTIRHLVEPADIDTTRVEMLPDYPELFAFAVVLSGAPDPVWIRCFHQVWKESRYLNKLEATFSAETIRFVCRQAQGIEDYLYFIERRIEETNRRMEAYWTARGIPVKRLKYEHYPSTFVPIGTF